MRTCTSIILLCCGLISAIATQAKDQLQRSWQQQVAPLEHPYMALTYTETQNEYYHSAEPWQTMQYTGSGTVWYNAGHFNRQDTMVNGKRNLYSKTMLDEKELLYLDYGHKEPSPISPDMITGQWIETARYTPAMLLHYFYRQKVKPVKAHETGFAAYKTTIDKTIVTLYIRTDDQLVTKITTLAHDDLHGDVLTRYDYDHYQLAGTLRYPASVHIHKFNGRLLDEVQVSKGIMTEQSPVLLERPADYAIRPKEEKKPSITTEKYNDHIYFLNLPHTGARAMVVAFKDYLLVAEAPLNAANGDMILAEARKIAPGKPVKYFSFGHHHPHYLGGMRPFIHHGATVLSVAEDETYLQYLATAPHTLQPDSLQLEPRPLQLQKITDSLTLTDGQFTMRIFHIGSKSGHTKDYLVYYFPEEKMLYEGDLVWIEKAGVPVKARGTQAGLYQSIKELHLNVDKVMQSWGMAFDGYKMNIPFSDLEAAMNVK